MSKFETKITKIGEDILVYDISVRNSDITIPLLASYNERREDSLLEKPDDWYMTITRFSTDNGAIPLMICPIVLGQSNVNLTPYSISFTFLTDIYTESVIFVPTEDTNKTPNAPTTQQDLSTGYYHINSYQHFLDMINTALTNQFTIMKTAHGGAITATEAPYLIYDPTTKIISLVAQYSFSVTGQPKLYFNPILYRLFSSFNTIFSYSGSTNGLINIVISDNKNNWYIKGGTNPIYTAPPPYLKIDTEYSTISALNSLHDIVIKTKSIPVKPEFTNTNLTVGSLNTDTMLTDFSPALIGAGNQRSDGFYFYQTGPYRWINLLSKTPLKSFDFSIFWRDKLGNEFPIYIAYNNEASVKFLFIRKDSSLLGKLSKIL